MPVYLLNACFKCGFSCKPSHNSLSFLDFRILQSFYVVIDLALRFNPIVLLFYKFPRSSIFRFHPKVSAKLNRKLNLMNQYG